LGKNFEEAVKPEVKSQMTEVRNILLIALLALIVLNGCVTKTEAKRQAQVAFMQGQQQAMMRMQQMQSHGPSVSFTGPVQSMVVAWHPGLTLAKAIISANYLGSGDPSAIVIHRYGQDIPIDPKTLLNGEDVPLQNGDTVEIQP
jgi:hypothetical protein